MSARRIVNEPAYVLHRYDWSETSLILDVFTRRHGRVALVAKGAKRPSSNFRPVLLPLQPLHLAFGGEAEIRTLKGAEWVGGHVMPTGGALLSGYYLNELLMRLLARDDPHPALFDAYVRAVQVLASAHGEALDFEVQPEAHGAALRPREAAVNRLLQPALRAFELLLLRETGLLPALDAQTLTLAALHGNRAYCLVPEGGLRAAHGDDRASLPGAQWWTLQAALDDPAPFLATLRVCAEFADMPAHMSALKAQLRALLHYHCGVGTLRTRRMMMELQEL